VVAATVIRRTAAGVTPGMSTSRTTAAPAGPDRSAARPARNDEAMPDAQSGLSMNSRPGAAARTRADSAPITTRVGAQPAAVRVAAAWCTSRLPRYATSALGIP